MEISEVHGCQRFLQDDCELSISNRLPQKVFNFILMGNKSACKLVVKVTTGNS